MDISRHNVVDAGGWRQWLGESLVGIVPPVPQARAHDAGPVNRCCAVGMSRRGRSGAFADIGQIHRVEGQRDA
jgi:hypothetical protein